ncbi:MAG: hypothetical protein PHC75_09610 [Burkholderiales bacterium]|nr:hypothetical protein [Burkholderiales bacterium]
MFINKDSIVINGVSMGKYLVEAQFLYPKLWGSDTGRETLAGTFGGTFKGVFPKLVLQYRKLTQTELELLSPIFDSPFQTLTYYDTSKKANITMTTYSGDWAVINKTLGVNEGLQVSFTSTSKRV